MRFTRLLILAASVLIFSAAAWADSVDPAIGVQKGGTGSTLWGDGSGAGFFSVFFVPGTAGVTCVGSVCDYVTPNSDPFFITSGSITDFEYSFDQSQNIGFTVAPGSVFTQLFVQNDVNSPNPIAFLSAAPGGGIFPAPTCNPCIFSTTGSASNSIVGDFGLTATGVALGTTAIFTSNVPVPVPEPASIALMLSGLGALGVRRLRSRRASLLSKVETANSVS